MANAVKILASVLFSVWACAVSFIVFEALKSWGPFCIHHPGVVLVVVGVIGETIGRRKKVKRLSGWILILGLILEMREAVKSDGQILALQSQGRALQLKIQPRIITTDKKEAFSNMVFLVSRPHENPLSQFIGIKVVVGVTDFETFSFAKQLAGFLRDVGLKTNDDIVTTPDIILMQNPQNPASGFVPCDVICCYCSTNGELLGQPIPGTKFMTPNEKGRALNDLCRIMSTMGFSAAAYDGKDLQIFGKKIMQPGEFAVFVPEKVPY
jgi:hypothetical protein